MARRASSRQRGAAHLQEGGGGGRELTLSAAREVKTECEARRRRGWARRRSSHQTIFDVAQLRAGGHDRADAVGGGHATSESRRSPLRARRAKAAMSGASISHLWAVIGVTSRLSSRDMGRAWGHAGPVCSSSAN